MSYEGSSNANIDSFRTGMQRLQPPNRYSITLDHNAIGIFKSYPDGIVIPDRNIETLPYTPTGYTRQIPIHGTTGQLLVSFIMLNNMAFISYIERWIKYIAGTSQYSYAQDASLQTVRLYDECIGTVMITMNSARTNSITKKYISDEVYPLSIQPIEMAAASTGYLTCNVIFYVRGLKDANITDNSSTVDFFLNQTIIHGASGQGII